MPLKLTTLSDLNQNVAIDIDKMAAASTPRYSRRIINLIDTTDRSSGTTWTLGYDSGNISGFKAGSVLKISYMYPARNESSSWGGLYFEPQIRYNNGVWQSLGSRGYDAVMNTNSGGNIRYTDNVMYVDPAQSADYYIAIRFYFKSYDGTVGLNNSQGHNINAISGTAPLMAGNNGNQHYGNWIIEELALLKGI